MSEPQDIKAIEHVQALLLGYDPTQAEPSPNPNPNPKTLTLTLKP